MIREQGYGSKLFYYTLSGEYTTFNMRETLHFKDPVDVLTWAECVEDTLVDFPELAVCPVIRDNLVCYEANHNEPPVLKKRDGEEPIRYFGTDDTNGYLFYFLCDDKDVLVSFFHGLTDGVGMESFLDCVLYRYGQRKGILKADDVPPACYEARCESDTVKELVDCTTDEIDPYGHFADTLGLICGTPEALKPAFFIPRDAALMETHKVHVYDVVTKTPAYLSQAKKLGVSFTGLLLPVICTGIARAHDLSEETVTAMLPVNLRQIYPTETVVNFSDGIFFPQDKTMRSLPLAEQASKTAARLKEKMSRDYYDTVIAGKVAAVRGIEASEKPIAEIEPVPVAALPEGAITPVSCAVTYPRRKQEYSFLAKAEYSCVVSASLSVVVFTAGDEMVIRCIQKSDTHVHAEAIAAVLSEAGISAEAVDRGYLEGDILRTGMLKRI